MSLSVVHTLVAERKASSLCTRIPPRALQPSASNLPGLEVVARGPSSLQLSMPQTCNRTCVSCGSMHAVSCFCDALGRPLSLAHRERDAFLRIAMGHDRLPILSARRAQWRRYMPEAAPSQSPTPRD